MRSVLTLMGLVFLLSLNSMLPGASFEYEHEFDPGELDKSWEVWKYSEEGSTLVGSGDTSTTLTLPLGLYLVKIHGSISRGSSVVAADLQTEFRYEEHFEYSEQVEDPALLQVGVYSSRVFHGGNGVQVQASALGTGNADAFAGAGIKGTMFGSSASAHVSLSGAGSASAVASFLPGVTYEMSASASGFPRKDAKILHVQASASYSVGGAQCSAGIGGQQCTSRTISIPLPAFEGEGQDDWVIF